MNDGDIFFTYSFNAQETKMLRRLLYNQQKMPASLNAFSKALDTALMKHISLEEAESLFHEKEKK